MTTWQTTLASADVAPAIREDPPQAIEERRPVVLVVEDNPPMNRFLCRCLAPEYATLTAEDGAEGLAKAREYRPELILTDVMMPRMSGPELVRAVRADPLVAGIPILVLTAREDEPLRVELLRVGAQDYLTKPFSVDELLARVSNLISAKRARDLLQHELATRQEDLGILAEQIAGQQHELKQALREARSAREAAEAASQINRNFLRMMSHELRTPVTAVHLQLELFERDLGSGAPALNDLVKRMRSTMQRLLDLIESCLEYARIESGRFELRRGQVPLETVAQEVLAEFALHAQRKKLELRYRGPGDLPLLDSDRRLVRLITVNLVANAVRYTERGFVSVETRQEPGVQILEVADSGPGIPPERQGEIFEPFRQLGDIRQREGSGSGLGLWLVMVMTEALGGEVAVRSEPGHGSVFTIRFPVRPAP